MIVFNHSCQGESHKASGKECQDYSLAFYDSQQETSIVVVSDGHGGASYFRSAFGAKSAVEITVDAISTFVSQQDKSLFAGLPFVDFGGTAKTTCPHEVTDVMTRLFSCIYTTWRKTIVEDRKRPLTEWEEKNVEDKYKAYLTNSEKIAKVYGCTLMAYVQTPNYWFAFHLGDGKGVFLDENAKFCQPIPWDERCFLNKTTSMCDAEPIPEFRFCAQGNGKFPIAVFLGSDGIDDTYKDGDKLYNFYGNILKILEKNGIEEVKQELIADLPKISKIGSQDDMSVAFACDETRLKSAVSSVNDQQIQYVLHEIEEIKSRIAQNKEKLLPASSNIDEKERLFVAQQKIVQEISSKHESTKKLLEPYAKQFAEARMAKKELERLIINLENLKNKKAKYDEFQLPEVILAPKDSESTQNSDSTTKRNDDVLARINEFFKGIFSKVKNILSQGEELQ